LQCQVKRRWEKRTDSGHGYRIYPNRLKGLEVSRPNQAWVADITYIRILTGSAPSPSRLFCFTLLGSSARAGAFDQKLKMAA